MSKFKEIGGATLNYGLGKFIPQIIGFLLIPIYTQYMLPEDYGVLELATSFGSFAMIFMRLALPGSVARFYYEHKEGPELRDYVTTLYWALMAISVGMAVIIFILSYFFLERLVPNLPLWPFAVVVLFTGILNSNSEIQKRLIQARKLSRYSATLSIISSLVGISLAVLFVVGFRLGGFGIVLASLVGGIIFFIQAQVYLHKDMGGKFTFSMLKPSFRYSLNILPSHLVSPFGNLFSRSLLSGFTSLASVGLYSLAFRFITPLYLLSDAFSTAFVPIYFEARKKDSPEGYKKLEEACKKIWIIALFVFLGVVALVPPFIYLATPERYHQAAELIPFMAVGFLVTILIAMYSPEMYYSKKTAWVSVVAVTRFISNLVIGLVLIRYWGYYALILARFAENIIELVFSVRISRKMFDFNPNVPFIIKTSLIALALAIVLVFFSKYQADSIMQLLAGITTLILFITTLLATRLLNIKTLKNYLNFKRL